MKNLFRVALIKSVSLCHAETGKLLCQILSATKSKTPRPNGSSGRARPSVVTMDDYFTTNHQLALYLHRSDSCTKKYRLQGYIPFINEGGSILVKKLDVDKAVKLYPQLIASSPLPSRPVPRIFTRIVEANDAYTFIHVSYQGEHFWIPVTPPEKAKDRKGVHTICHTVIQLLHQIKPFKIAPDLTKMAA